jgi:hypothetical protein
MMKLFGPAQHCCEFLSDQDFTSARDALEIHRLVKSVLKSMLKSMLKSVLKSMLKSMPQLSPRLASHLRFLLGLDNGKGTMFSSQVKIHDDT